MFFLLTAVQNLKSKSNAFFQSYEHKCTATFFMNHSVFTTRTGGATGLAAMAMATPHLRALWPLVVLAISLLHYAV